MANIPWSSKSKKLAGNELEIQINTAIPSGHLMHACNCTDVSQINTTYGEWHEKYNNYFILSLLNFWYLFCSSVSARLFLNILTVSSSIWSLVELSCLKYDTAQLIWTKHVWQHEKLWLTITPTFVCKNSFSCLFVLTSILHVLLSYTCNSEQPTSAAKYPV